MRVLITGGTGLLGKALIETIDNTNYEIIATYLGNYNMEDTTRIKYKKLDVRDIDGYSSLFREFKPEVVVHTAGIGSPDYAERNKEETWEVNVGGTQNILNNCEQYDSKFIYISSNGIYDGNKAPYSENDKAEPINYYGKIKVEGERITQESRVINAIIRPILMYGWNYSFERPNIVTLSLSKLQKGDKVFVYDDVYANPLFVQSCAEAIWMVIEEGKYDTFNIGGKDGLSVYEFIKKAAKIFELDANLIIPVQQGFLNELTKRPKDTSYNTEKMQKALGLEPLSIIEGLLLMRKSNKS